MPGNLPLSWLPSFVTHLSYNVRRKRDSDSIPALDAARKSFRVNRRKFRYIPVRIGYALWQTNASLGFSPDAVNDNLMSYIRHITYNFLLDGKGCFVVKLYR